jgi:predicted RNA-binding protein with PIN domain
MPYLIDTYNLLHAALATGGVFSNTTLRRLCQWITASPRSLQVTFILDGRKKPDEPDESEFPAINFIYSGVGITADTVIAQTLERAQNRKKLTVVTNDRAIILHARAHFAAAMSCEAFLSELLSNQPGQKGKRPALPPQKTAGTATSGETDHWLKEFGLTAPPPPADPHPLDPENPDDLDMDQLLGPKSQ